MTPDQIEQSLLDKVEAREVRARRRAVFYTAIPVVAICALVWIGGHRYQQLVDSDRRLEQVRAESATLIKQAEDARNSLLGAGKDIEAALTVLRQLEAFVEREKPFMRSADHARLLISIRMAFDKLNDTAAALSKSMPDVVDKLQQRPRRWVTIVSSSSDLGALRRSVEQYQRKMPDSKLAIYRSVNGFYGLAVLGDGSFTDAYRKTVELKNRDIAPMAYFADATSWDLIPK
jgi:hypothetical protein